MHPSHIAVTITVAVTIAIYLSIRVVTLVSRLKSFSLKFLIT